MSRHHQPPLHVAPPRRQIPSGTYMGEELTRAPVRPGAQDAYRLPSIIGSRRVTPGEPRAEFEPGPITSLPTSRSASRLADPAPYPLPLPPPSLSMPAKPERARASPFTEAEANAKAKAIVRSVSGDAAAAAAYFSVARLSAGSSPSAIWRRASSAFSRALASVTVGQRPSV